MRTLRLALVQHGWPWRAVLLSLALATAGCRTDPATTLLERDLRMQEDRIYQLEACLDDACAAREATIRENESLKKELDSGDRGAGSESGADREFSAPSVELPGGTSPPPAGGRETPDLSPPTIELPGENSSPPVESGLGGKQTVILEQPPTQLVINKRLTGGLDRDGHGGDEGILVVFEPRDAAGNLVKWPGAVSVVVMDPALDGEAARVARWDFAPQEVPHHALNTAFGRGLQFELRWPNQPPKHRELQLFVRFTSEDGRKLTADATIDVRPAVDGSPGDRQTKRRSRSAQVDDQESRDEGTLQASRPEWKPFR